MCSTSPPWRIHGAGILASVPALLGVPMQAQSAPPGAPDPEEAPSPAPGAAPGWHGRVELRRDDTDRGDPEEVTKTFLRVDSYLSVGTFSVQVPLPDDMTADHGRFNPKLGDLKVRHRSVPFASGPWTMSVFLEAVFPTADPEELGTGKYQASAGWTSTRPLATPARWSASHLATVTAQLQQTNSVAGDPARTDINYTKLDLSTKDTWSVHWVKLAVNTRVDWVQDGRTGAVGEVEYGRLLGTQWKVWLMGGGLLWGEGVKGTYGRKVSVSVSRTF